MKNGNAMKSAAVAPAKKVPIRIAVVESDPLRFVGLRALFDSEPDFELISASLPDIGPHRSEEHTSELQSHHDLVCRLLLEKKKIRITNIKHLYITILSFSLS